MSKLTIEALAVEPRRKASNYPAPFATRIDGRVKRALGDPFGLKNFGVNLTQLAPGSQTALLHKHSKQDEWVYVLEGHPTLITEEDEAEMAPGMCAGFQAGGIAHHIVNRSDETVLLIEVGDRSAGDEGSYPQDDLKAVMAEDGRWRFTRKDGTPY